MRLFFMYLYLRNCLSIAFRQVYTILDSEIIYLSRGITHFRLQRYSALQPVHVKPV